MVRGLDVLWTRGVVVGICCENVSRSRHQGTKAARHAIGEVGFGIVTLRPIHTDTVQSLSMTQWMRPAYVFVYITVNN